MTRWGSGKPIQEALAVRSTERAPDAFWRYGVSIEGADARQLSLFRSDCDPSDSLLLPSAAETPAHALGTAVLWRVRRGASPDPRHLEDFRKSWIGRRTAPHAIATEASVAQHAESPTPMHRRGKPGAPAHDTRPVVLAIIHGAMPQDDQLLDGAQADRITDDNGLLDCELEPFAWRLERHWLVEWSESHPHLGGRSNAQSKDSPDTGPTHALSGRFRRPPVMMLEHRGVTIIGADLLPQVRPVLAALTAFEIVTADELRAAFGYLEMPTPAASELSRTLSYLEECGFLVVAPTEIAEQYRKRRRAIGRRPLRVYLSAPYPLARDLGALLGHRALDSGGAEPGMLGHDGTPSAPATAELSRWNEMTEILRDVGLRTI